MAIRLACRGIVLVPVIVIVVTLISCLGVGIASADDPIKLAITPVGATGANFVLTLRPTETRDLSVLLSNHGTATVRARAFAADAYSMVNGGFAARLDGQASGGTTSWLDFSTADVDLAPGVTIEREFTLAVPAGTLPGEYLTTIVLQNADPTSGDPSAQGGMVLKQIVRQILAISVDVPGMRLPALELGPFTHRIVAERSTISVGVNNVGNVRLNPTGEFVLWDSAGLEVTRFPLVMDTVYAHTNTTVEIPFSRRLNPGDYTAVLDMTDSIGLAATSTRLPLVIEDSVAASTPESPLAQSSQPAVAAVALLSNPWVIVGVSFAAGLALMLAIVGVGFAIKRRRARINAQL